MNKKGVLAAYLVDFYAYLVFVAILIIFFILIAVLPPPSDKPELAGVRASADATLVLIRALQTPIIIDGKKTTPAEIVSEQEIDYEIKFKREMNTVLNKAGFKKTWFKVFKEEEKEALLILCSTGVRATVDVPLKNQINHKIVLVCIEKEES